MLLYVYVCLRLRTDPRGRTCREEAREETRLKAAAHHAQDEGCHWRASPTAVGPHKTTIDEMAPMI